MQQGVVTGADLAPGHLRAARLPRLPLKGLSQEAAVLLLKSSRQRVGSIPPLLHPGAPSPAACCNVCIGSLGCGWDGMGPAWCPWLGFSSCTPKGQR